MPLTYTVSDATTGSTIAAADLNSRFNDVKSKFAAGIVNGDISTTAAISVDKLDAQYEHMLVTLEVNASDATDFAWPAAAGTVVRSVIIPNDGKGDWVISAAGLVCSDVGADTAQVRFEWGRYVAGVWTVTSTPVTAVAINSDDSGVDSAGQQSLTIASATLAAGTHRQLAMVAAVDDAALLTNTDSYLSASFLLYRKIANG